MRRFSIRLLIAAALLCGEVLGGGHLAAQTKINLTTQVKGVLPVANGGTGSTSGGGALSGSTPPQGVSCTAGQSYIQAVAASDVSSNLWLCSANGAVWTNSVTQAVVYAGPATVRGLSDYYEMTDGSGSTTLADSVGSNTLTVNGGGAGGSPVMTTNGEQFTGTPGQYTVAPSNYGTQGSTYLICFNQTGNGSFQTMIFGASLSNNFPGLQTGNTANNLQFGASQTVATGLSTITTLFSSPLNTPVCYTVVYDGTGSDQIWLGTSKLPLSNSTATALSWPAFYLGGHHYGFIGTIYKFGVAIGTELAPDIIQHNALVAQAKLATQGVTVTNGETFYHAGSPYIVAVGDSRTEGQTPSGAWPAYVTPNVPNIQVFNGGIPSQLVTNFVSQGICTPSAERALTNYMKPVNGSYPQRFAVLDMGINDLNTLTAANIYPSWQSCAAALQQSGHTVIAMTVEADGTGTGTKDTQRIALNQSIISGGGWDALVDWADDLRWSNSAYGFVSFTSQTPYSWDSLHPNQFGAPAIAGRVSAAIWKLTNRGAGTNYTAPYSAYLDIDLSKGETQTVTLTGNVSQIKLINGNQGDHVDLTICQDATGGRTVAAPAVGSGATATVTSAGAMTLTAGGTGYDANYMPVFYVSGLTCGTYPRMASTVSNGTISSFTQVQYSSAVSGCSGTGTVTVVPTEPKWNNFNASAVNALAAGACLRQTFTYDALGQSIN